MIHRHVEIVDLDPLTWRHLGEILPIGDWADSRDKHSTILTILHQNGSVINIDTPAFVPASAIPKSISDPAGTAKKLYEAYPALSRVQIFEKNQLKAFSDTVQRQNWKELTSGDFYLQAWS